MKLCLYIWIVIATAYNFDLCYLWGDLAHSTSAYIATQYLNKNANNYINKILKNYKGPNNKTFKTLMDISIYPDYIRKIVPWADSYHYVNMNANSTKYSQAHCKPVKYCSVAALVNYTNVLKNSSIVDYKRLGEALSFTVHIFSDIFQPLHAGNVDDKGGVETKIQLSNEWKLNKTMQAGNLHWLWDHLIIANWMSNERKSEQDVWKALPVSWKTDKILNKKILELKS